ncbi:MAG: sulfatase, partial [Dysgonamonadaceae bacterium]
METIGLKLFCPFLGMAALSSCGGGKKVEHSHPYNIVFIMSDDHTRQMMSCYDKRHI